MITNRKDETASDWSVYMKQLKLVTMVSLGRMTSGTIVAFPSVIIADLDYNHTRNIYGDIISFTEVQKDSLGGVIGLGGLVGVIICGLTVARLGKRRVMVFLGLLALINWLGIAFASGPTAILLFRTLGGVVYGGFNVTVVAYIVELTEDANRASLALVAMIMFITGHIVIILSSHWLRYYHVALLGTLVPIVFMFLMIFVVPDSPTALVVKGDECQAKKVLKNIRSSDCDLNAEVAKIRDMNARHQNVDLYKSLTQKDVVINIGIVFGLFFINVFSGYPVFTAQTSRIISDSGGSRESVERTVLVHSAQLLGALVSLTFVSRLGRKGCLLLSQLLMGVSVAALAIVTVYSQQRQMATVTVYNQQRHRFGVNEDFIRTNDTATFTEHHQYNTAAPYQSNLIDKFFDWAPLSLLMLAQIGVSFGVQNAPFMMSAEYFPTAIRPQAVAICLLFGKVLAVAAFQLYSPLQAVLGQAGLLFGYSGVALTTIPFTYFIVRETAGKKIG